jgi:hypothetical protein
MALFDVNPKYQILPKSEFRTRGMSRNDGAGRTHVMNSVQRMLEQRLETSFAIVSCQRAFLGIPEETLQRCEGNGCVDRMCSEGNAILLRALDQVRGFPSTATPFHYVIQIYYMFRSYDHLQVVPGCPHLQCASWDSGQSGPNGFLRF